MSHIDEGELTAYADGAWAPEDPEAIRIAAHLAECANCRNRLAQEQALSGRASEILAVAAPVMTGAPTFEEVAARVAPRRHTRRRALPLSWAASVILAVGLGWYGHDMLYRPESAPSAPALPVRASAGAGAGDRASELGAGASASDIRAGESVVEAMPDASTGVGAEVRLSEPMVAAAPPPSTLGAAASMEAANALRAHEQDAAPEAKVADLASTAIEERRDIEYITAAEAENRRLPLRIVPELEVVRVGVISGAVQVEQKLPDGKIVMVTTRTDDDRTNAAVESEARSDAVAGGRSTGRAERSQSAAKQAAPALAPAPAPAQAPSLARAPAPALTTVRVMRGSAAITISGAISADSLRALVAKIR